MAIDRESQLSGNIHNKGVLILAGFLKSRFAQDKPLTLSASLAFEQSYGMVEGDSASMAELAALLSALAEAPLAQNMAMTGSVSQRGEAQPIGGVNWKIEGFYKVCKARGLDGTQGVIIPKANVQDLMLKTEVVEAVAAGKFHVWAIGHVDEAMELLTGVAAGQRRARRLFRGRHPQCPGGPEAAPDDGTGPGADEGGRRDRQKIRDRGPGPGLRQMMSSGSGCATLFGRPKDS